VNVLQVPPMLVGNDLLCIKRISNDALHASSWRPIGNPMGTWAAVTLKKSTTVG